MSVNTIICFAVSGMLAATAAYADETLIVSNLLGLEGPLYVDGNLLRRWDADKNGKPFNGGINDIVVTANGGAYATIFGPYKDLPTSVVGKILYLAPGSQEWVELADDVTVVKNPKDAQAKGSIVEIANVK
jgi:hypothetical protein